MSMLAAIARPSPVIVPPTPALRPHVAVAADGTRAVICDADGARQLDLHTRAATMLHDEPARFAACFSDETWIIAAQLHRFDKSGRPLGDAMALPFATRLAASRSGQPGVVGGGPQGWSL